MPEEVTEASDFNAALAAAGMQPPVENGAPLTILGFRFRPQNAAAPGLHVPCLLPGVYRCSPAGADPRLALAVNLAGTGAPTANGVLAADPAAAGADEDDELDEDEILAMMRMVPGAMSHWLREERCFL